MNKISLIILFFAMNLSAFSLKEGLGLALKNDIDTQTRQNDFETIKYDIKKAKGLYKPKLDLNAKLETTKRSTDSYRPTRQNSHVKTDEYELELRQPLYDGKDAKYENKLQKARLVSAEYYLLESKNRVTLRYVEAYINVLKEKDSLNLFKESFIISENIFDKISRKVEEGFGTKLEFEKAKARLEESKVNLTIQKINYRDAIESLKFYLQKDFDSNELIKPTFVYRLPDTLKKAQELAMDEHPSMLVSTNNLNVSIFEHKRDLKSFHPKVDFVGTYTLNDAVHEEANPRNEYKLGIEIAYNLYNGGKDRASENISLKKINEKKILIDKNRQQINNRLALAWNSYILNEQKEKEQKEFLLSKKFVLDTTLKEFDLGSVDLTALLDAHVEYINAKKSLISTSYDYLFAKFRVLEAMGIIEKKISQDKREILWDERKIDSSKLLDDVNSELKYLYENSTSEIYRKEHNKVDIQKDLEEFDKNFESIENSEDEYINTQSDESFLDFKEKFLSADKNKYTINLATSYSMIEANNFLDENGIEDSAFVFAFGKEKNTYKIMYGVFDSYREAKDAIELFSQKVRKNNPRVEKIGAKQFLYKKYNDEDFQEEIVVIEEQKEQNEDKMNKIPFKKRFLEASENKYTINLAISNSQASANRFMHLYGIEDNSFAFVFGKNATLYKIMYGVFDSYEDALERLKTFPMGLKVNHPRIEKVYIKQNLYKKYNK